MISLCLNCFLIYYYHQKPTYGSVSKLILLKKSYIRGCVSSLHDGSILVTDAFARYLTYHRPINKIFDAVIGCNPLGTKDFLLEKLVDDFKQIESANRTLGYQDETLITELFDGIYQRVDCFYRTQLSDTEKYLVSKLKEQELNISKTIEKGFDQNSNDIQQIRD